MTRSLSKEQPLTSTGELRPTRKDARTPQVVFFGPAKSGKSTLLKYFAQLYSRAKSNELEASSPHDDFVPLTTSEEAIVDGSSAACRREVEEYLLRVGDGDGPGSELIVCDTSSKAADELLHDPAQLEVRSRQGLLLQNVREADALVLVVDAAEDSNAVDKIFREFRAFLERLQARRTFGREVAGLPVFLTLTHCDKLYEPNDSAEAWRTRIAKRMEQVRERFRELFPEAVRQKSKSQIPFGTIDLEVRATATNYPEGLGNSKPVEDDQELSISQLALRVIPAAQSFHGKFLAASRRLKMTVAATATLLGLMLLGLVALAVFGLAGDPLARDIRDYQAVEGAPAFRLSDQRRATHLRVLKRFHSSPRFEQLAPDLQDYVKSRMEEVEAYQKFRGQLRPPQLGPADLRGRGELARLQEDLQGRLRPPEQYAKDWAKTEAVRLWEKWQADVTLLDEVESRLFDWYRNLIADGNALMFVEGGSLGIDWKDRLDRLLNRADTPPFDPKETIDGSPTVKAFGGQPLTYASVFNFDRIELARRDWQAVHTKLTNARDLAQALGLIAGEGEQPPLKLPAVGDNVNTLTLAHDRLRLLAPDGVNELPTGWQINQFPDPLRKLFSTHLRNNFQLGVRQVQNLLAAELSEDTPAAWRSLANGLLTQEPLADWGRLLQFIQRLITGGNELDQVPDPVEVLKGFLRQDSFPLDYKLILIEIAPNLRGSSFVVAGDLRLVLTNDDGESREVRFSPVQRRVVSGTTVHAFEPKSPSTKPIYRLGEKFVAKLPLRSGTIEYSLTWDSPRSAVYQFDALHQAPVLDRVGTISSPERIESIKLLPDTTGGPANPILLPRLIPSR